MLLQVTGGALVCPRNFFKLTPARLGSEGELAGWEIAVTPAKEPGKDYIYPVNPPLRFNPSQTLGASYGEGAKASLASSHGMHFLLTRSDYDRIQPLLTNALWPYSAPDPDEAANQYVTALECVVVWVAEDHGPLL